jgi:hypothetical protein
MGQFEERQLGWFAGLWMRSEDCDEPMMTTVKKRGNHSTSQAVRLDFPPQTLKSNIFTIIYIIKRDRT